MRLPLEGKVPPQINRDTTLRSPALPRSDITSATMPWVRLIISCAARRVKVSMRMREGSVPLSTRCAVRCARVLVLPVPAPARISSGPALTPPLSATAVPNVAARRCPGLSVSKAFGLVFIIRVILYVYPDVDATHVTSRSIAYLTFYVRGGRSHTCATFSDHRHPYPWH